MDNKLRFAHAALVAEQYTDFRDFAMDGMAFLGFDTTEMQADIAEFMQNGPRLRMVMAQRGEAKSTLAALYAVWRLVQRANCRILVVSAGETQASEVALLIIRLIQSWDILEYLRPDKNAGDRTSVDAFDVHWALKGLDKSPSVACVGITSNLQGKRADLLIPDDVESSKNGLTAVQRGQLLTLTKDFSSICTHGDILYLGTPQTKDSIYNTLPGRGFTVRIWPGRFPTEEEQAKYGERLAPFIVERILADPTLRYGGGLDGTKGKPADPGRYTESALLDKELDQGPEGFQLQYMLDTSLADAARQQLKLENLLVANYDYERLPEVQVYQASPKYAVDLTKFAPSFPIPLTTLYHPVPTDCLFVSPKEAAMMYLDPAGGGADEMGIAVSASLGPYIHLLDVKGLKGGLTDANVIKIISTAVKYRVKTMLCESNMGHGLFETMLKSEIAKAIKHLEDREDTDMTRALLSLGLASYALIDLMKHFGVVGEYSTGQKERRIIDSFVSPSQRHKIIIHRAVFESDAECNAQHSMEKRQQYSFFYQYANITTDRGSLPHDDRVEAAAGAVRYWKGVLVQDEDKAAEQRSAAEAKAHIADPMGYGNVRNKTKGVRRLIDKRR